MVVEKILKELTPERRKKEIEKIQNIKLPPELQRWVDEYEKVGERDGFIWKWIYNISQIITLYEVEKKYQKFVWEIKFLIIMFDVLIDDVADKGKNKKLLKELLKIPFNQHYIEFKRLNNEEKKYIKFTIKVWRRIYDLFKQCPRFEEFKDFFEYDIKQMLNAMEYAYLSNKYHYLINEVEYKTYFAHNMQLIIDIMIDLSCLSKFDIKELGKIREIAWYAQHTTRICNWLNTWEREIKENDFTSGVFACAIDNLVILTQDLKKMTKLEIIKKIKRSSKIEKQLLKKWEKNYQKVKKLNKDIKTIKVEKILLFLKKVMLIHLISRGYI